MPEDTHGDATTRIHFAQDAARAVLHVVRRNGHGPSVSSPLPSRAGPGHRGRRSPLQFGNRLPGTKEEIEAGCISCLNSSLSCLSIKATGIDYEHVVSRR
jgi:hypothetical protein